MTRVTRRCVKFVARFEGFVDHAYKPVASEQYLTIGYGHYGPDVKPGDTITKRKAKRLLKHDLREYAAAVDDFITPKLTSRQRDALISFTYNNGIGSLQDSSLRHRLNNGESVCKVLREELPRWVYGGGQRLPGLVRRRAAEVRLACG